MKRILTTLKEKWPEYLLEILVLIIGIYGAFALENYRDERNSRDLESSYLLAINKEFKENQKQFKRVINKHQQTLSSYKGMLSEYEKETPNADSLLNHWIGLWNVYTFDPSHSSIESLLSTSSIDIIQNLELRQLLLSWKDMVVDYQQEELIAREYAERSLIPYMETNFDYQEWNKGKPYLGKVEPKFKNILITRMIFIGQILDNEDQERSKIERTMNKIIELTEVTK